MSLRGFSEVTNITPILGLILLGISYFYSCLILKPISFFLRISYLTGGLLVNKFLLICNFMVEIIRLSYSLFEIIYEDSLIFFKDAAEKFTYALILLKQYYSILEKGFQAGCAFIWDIFNFIYGAVEVVVNFFSFLQQTVITSKQMLHFAGSSIWNFILSIPEMVITNITAIYDLLSTTMQEIGNLQYKFNNRIIQSFEILYEFLFDFPLDSIYGLIIGGVLLTIFCIKIKDISLMIFSGLVKLYQCTTSLLTYLWTGRFLDHKEKTNFIEDDERLCVVCQYQMKEIIIFPCKHLCLCWDCSIKLSRAKKSCPICRTHIAETLKVYV